MVPETNNLSMFYPSNFAYVILNGKIIGYVDNSMAETFVNNLRILKVT